MQTDLLAALKEAIRFNAPDEHRLGFRRVGFILPDEVAWPADKTGYDIPDAILAALAASPLSGEMGEVERVAKAIAPRIFYEFDGETMDRAAKWDIHCDQDKQTMRLIAQDAIAALRSSGIDGGE